MKPLTLSLLLAILSAPTMWADPPAESVSPPPQRILFIGNSYTQSYEMPTLVEQAAASQGYLLECERVTKGGWSLEKHLADEKPLAMIARGGWDVVVLQDYSYRPVSDPDGTRASVQTFAAAAHDVGAQVVLYMTWAYADPKLAKMHGKDWSSMQASLAETYRQASRDVGGSVAPVGEAWALARREHPEWKLHVDDGSHPTRLGAYLTVVVMTETLCGPVDATTLPETLYAAGTAPKPGATLELRDLVNADLEQRRELVRIARQALKAESMSTQAASASPLAAP